MQLVFYSQRSFGLIFPCLFWGCFISLKKTTPFFKELNLNGIKYQITSLCNHEHFIESWAEPVDLHTLLIFTSTWHIFSCSTFHNLYNSILHLFIELQNHLSSNVNSNKIKKIATRSNYRYYRLLMNWGWLIVQPSCYVKLK